MEIKDTQIDKIIEVITERPNGRIRIQKDYSQCISKTEQHNKDTNDLNVLIKKFKPDQLASYMMARNQKRREITGHDFSQEPDLQSAKNEMYLIQKEFDALPMALKVEFQTPLNFIKFKDNPKNAEVLKQLGISKEIAPEMTSTSEGATQEQVSAEKESAQ